MYLLEASSQNVSISITLSENHNYLLIHLPPELLLAMAVLPALLRTLRPADYNISTWLIVGATLQCMLVATLPRNIALLPPCALLVFRVLRGYLIANGTIPNPSHADVFHGRRTWQIPTADGSEATSGSRESVVVLVLCASWSHPNGKFSPGSQFLGQGFADMWADAHENREKYGFLGNTPAMGSQDDGERKDSMGQTQMYLSYWKTLEGLHKFAHGSVHMRSQLWWEKGAMEEFPHIGVMHEVYEVPAGNWENVFHNFRPFGICKLASCFCYVGV
jgi:hypothetical protein